MYSPHLNLIAASPTLCPPADFPPNHKFTGVWHLASANYTPPPELVNFLGEGPPPVIITFGSMGGSNGRETTAILIDAVRKDKSTCDHSSGMGTTGDTRNTTGYLLYRVCATPMAISERVLRCPSRGRGYYCFSVSRKSAVCCCRASRGSAVLGETPI